MSGLDLLIYSAGTTPIFDSGAELGPDNISDVWYATINKGGLYAGAGCWVPRVPSRWWEIRGQMRAVIKYGSYTVYEGRIVALDHVYRGDVLGIEIKMTGFWGDTLARRTIKKVWCDNRYTEPPWILSATASAYDYCFVDRNERFRFIPKAETWGLNDVSILQYRGMVNDTIARVVYDYDFSEGSGGGALAFELSLWRSADGSTWTQMTAASGETYNTGTTTVINANGSGSIDVEPAAGTKYLELRYYSRAAAQTPTSDGTYYANVTGLMVYSEDEGANQIGLISICEDIISDNADILNADTSHLETMTTPQALEPFMTGYDGNSEFIADVIYSAAQYGDGNNQPWTVGLLASTQAATPDGLPVLYAAPIPDTTAGNFDYCLSLDDDRVVGDVVLSQDYFDNLVTAVTVQYTNELGWFAEITPDDESTLMDTSEYERVDYVLVLGNASYADALAQGVRYLNQHKTPQWRCSSALTIAGSLDDTYGQPIPAARVNALQKIIKIDNYGEFLITGTEYNADTDEVSIYLGVVQSVTVMDRVWAMTWDDSVGGGGGLDGGASMGGQHKRISDRTGLRWLQLSDPAKYRQIKNQALAYRSQHGGSLKNAIRQLGYGHLMRL